MSNSLWQNRDFLKLWAAQAISEFGSVITGTVLPLVAILLLAATPAQVGLLSALGALPALLFGLPAGVWVDRVRRRPLLIAADLGRAGLLITIPLLAANGRLTLPHLYFVAFTTGTLSLLFGIADNAHLPSLLPHEALVEGNSKLGMSSSLAEVAGPALGGALVQLITAPATLVIDVMTYLCSALLLGLIRQPEPPPATPTAPPDVRREMKEGLTAVWQTPILRTLALSSGLFNFFGSFIGALYAVYVLETLHLTPALLGLFVSVGGIGALLGTAVASQAIRRWGVGRVLSHSLLLAGGVGLLLPLASFQPAFAIPILLLNQLIGDIFISNYLINETTLRQTATAPHLLGRVNASLDFVVQGIGPLGLLCGGFLGGTIGVRNTLFVAVAGIALAGFSITFSPIRHLADYPMANPEEKAKV